MRDSFRSAQRPHILARLTAIAVGLAGLALGTRVTQTSLDWIGRPFPGFVVIDNRIVASIALPHWTGASSPDLFHTEVEAVDGVPVHGLDALWSVVRANPPGTTLRYTLRDRSGERSLSVPTAVFTLYDWVMLFGTFLLSGSVFLGSGLLAWVIRPASRLSSAMLAFGASSALFLFTAVDLYGPSDFFDLHLASEVLVPASALQLLLVFPDDHRFFRWRHAGYPLAAVLLSLLEWTRNDPQRFLIVFDVCAGWLGVTGLLIGARMMHAVWRARTALARQRMRVVVLGTLVGVTVPGLVVLISSAMGRGLGTNTVVFTFWVFPLALAYGVIKHDAFDIDAMVKRGAYYLVFTSAVAATYALAIYLLNLGLAGTGLASSPLVPVLLTLGVLLFFDPLRRRLQALVDRLFFRTSYDGASVLADVGGRLAAALRHDEISELVREGVGEAIPNIGTRLFFEPEEGAAPREVGGTLQAPESIVAALESGRIPTVEDPPELYEDVAARDEVAGDLASLGAELAVPMRLRGRVVGLLAVGAKRSGLFFTAGDAEFLRAIAHQAAIALQNARSYEALVALNADLERRVEHRTAELAATNSELAGANQALSVAYEELKNAEVQLVQSAKMASLGRLAAGVAHEINNPVSFIASNVEPLRRRLDKAGTASPEERDKLLRQARDLVDIMGRGAQRTVAIVEDLRSFTRLNEAKRKIVDLREGLDVTIRLLESRWRERIAIHRDYRQLPPLECEPSQMNQVFMNLLANACDAIEGRGDIWVSSRVDGDDVVISIRDSGRGIEAGIRQRIFDPFFTTKDVGQGTGLGLAIVHGIVTSHGGRIDLETDPGTGTTFHVHLPLRAADDATVPAA